MQDSFFAMRDALRQLRDSLPQLNPPGVTAEPAWRARLVRNVLPALDFDLPVLLVALCGGGSTGKSTLFNMLAGRPLAAVGFKAGLTARVTLAGHPQVLSSPAVAEGLLHRLRERPVPWRSPEDAVRPGPPLYAQAEHLSRNLLLIDTPDFDTDLDGELVHRGQAEPVLRTAEVLVYLFTNTVYNNLSNTQFMADVVGGIGGRPTVLIYRISRAASDAEALSHCRVVAGKLFGYKGTGLPEQVIGVYRMHESDAVAEGDAQPKLLPLTENVRRRSLNELLSSLDVTRIKRHVFAADLQAIHAGASADLAVARQRSQQAGLYRQALNHMTAQRALDALRAFPANEAVALATRVLLETSPGYVKVLRGTGRVVSAPLRGAQALARRIGELTGVVDKPAPPPDLSSSLSQDLLLAANALRNSLMDDALIVPVGRNDALLDQVRAVLRGNPAQPVPLIEALDKGTYNLHIPAPDSVRQREPEMLSQDWQGTARTLEEIAEGLVGLPADIERELKGSVREFRKSMGLMQRVREAFFASLSALPSLLGVTYVLMTANPVSGAGLWIQLESLFGVNDLWALVSIPASAGLSEQERHQLEQMIAPVFRLWLQRRSAAIVEALGRTVCRPVLAALDEVPDADDPRFAELDRALITLQEAS